MKRWDMIQALLIAVVAGAGQLLLKGVSPTNNPLLYIVISRTTALTLGIILGLDPGGIVHPRPASTEALRLLLLTGLPLILVFGTLNPETWPWLVHEFLDGRVVTGMLPHISGVLAGYGIATSSFVQKFASRWDSR